MTEKVNENSTNLFRKMYIRIPDFCLSHWLLRIPLAVVFIQQGLSKFPVIAEDAKQLIEKIPAIESAQVDIIWDPPWNPHMISNFGRKKLKLD